MEQLNARQSYELKTNYIVDMSTRISILKSRIATAQQMEAFWLVAELKLSYNQLIAMRRIVKQSVLQDVPF